MTKIKDKLPKNPFSNIAISLSGGGFRATAFHLGVISYLSEIKFSDITLLERTRILSTVSAGTFTGVKYVSTLKNGGTIKDCYKSLYAFMCNCDLVSESLQYLSDNENWKGVKRRTLINAFASIYHREFESENFGLLYDEKNSIHLKEISFNATEFNFALPFRFQKTEKSTLDQDRDFYVGNKKIHIPLEVAKEIRLADIIAASSCFPFGFEPINFPDDFIHDDAIKMKDSSLLPNFSDNGDKIHYPIGLMDGSIDDNQGVDAVVMAEERMKHYPAELQAFSSDDEKTVDLYIISDASPPKMENYTRSIIDKIPVIGTWNFKSLRLFGVLSAISGISAIIYAFYTTIRVSIIGLSIFGTLGLLTAFILLVFSLGLTGLTRRLGVPEFVVKRMLHFDKLKLGTLYNMLLNRRKSSMTLVSDVFIKHMRWFSYERVYGDSAWRPRLIMNAAFEFTEDEVEKRRKKYPYFNPEILEPGDQIIKTATKANEMGTKLWFTTEELEGAKNMPDTLIACGQFTMCFSLLEYIEKYIKNKKYQRNYKKYSAEIKNAIDELENELLKDWKKFKTNPYWMVNEWKESR
ncbi:MAG: patatin-like phospholipase family protein [Bacteroidetes bacterium]|nr:patatin-like phospholipase family protein [Bacteroidota bacterium]